MKILLIVVSAVVVVVAAMVVIGLLLPKGHVASRSASFRATPEKLFVLIAGAQNWRPDVVRYEPAGDGFVRETTKNGETITYQLLDQVPPTSMTRRIATENLPYSGTWTFSLQAHNGITDVRITERGEVYNPVFRFVSRFILGHTYTMDAYLNALGKAVGEEVELRN
jgi:hypothetical protein